MKKVNLLSILLSIVFFMFSCSNDKEFSENSSENGSPDDIPTARIISDEQAQVFGNLIMAAILEKDNIATRSATPRSSSEVIPILDNRGQTVLYAINFDKNQGFIIISADKEATNSLLAFNDTGHFELSAMVVSTPMGQWLNEQKEIISKRLAEEIDKDNESYKIWELFDSDTDVTIEIVDFESVKDLIPATTRGIHENSYGLTNIAVGEVIFNCLWGQGEGYNADAPNPGVDYAGCPAVAIGLLCRYHYSPTRYDYANMPNVLNTTSSNAISKMFRNIADSIPNYSWSAAYSGAGTGDIYNGLKKIGYSNVSLGVYNFQTAYNNIAVKRPVLLAGYDANGAGHIWIADGYWESIFQITPSDPSQEIGYMYQDYFFMNWGWNGTANAWIDQESVPYYGNYRLMYYNLIPDN